MKLFREGRLSGDSIQTGNVLVVELHSRDAEALASPERYTMNRFSSFPHTYFEGGMGWQPMDKVHLQVEDPPQSTELPVELSLDPGGDLYFTIWDNQALHEVGFDTSFEAAEPFLTADPSLQLARVGVDTIRFFGLNVVARALESSPQSSFF